MHRTIYESSNYKDSNSISSKANEFEAHRKSQNYQSRDRAYSNDKNMPNKKHVRLTSSFRNTSYSFIQF